MMCNVCMRLIHVLPVAKQNAIANKVNLDAQLHYLS